jgi:hypothetical protein
LIFLLIVRFSIFDMHDGESSPNILRPDRLASPQYSVFGKFTLRINCDEFLLPTTSSSSSSSSHNKKPNSVTPMSVDQAVSCFQLDSLLAIPIMQELKIKCFHTCGLFDLEEDLCLSTLWGVAEWLVQQFRAVGKEAECYASTEGRGADWAEPDVEVVIFIDHRKSGGGNREDKGKSQSWDGGARDEG